jgi:hypothetical protein
MNTCNTTSDRMPSAFTLADHMRLTLPHGINHGQYVNMRDMAWGGGALEPPP